MLMKNIKCFVFIAAVASFQCNGMHSFVKLSRFMPRNIGIKYHMPKRGLSVGICGDPDTSYSDLILNRLPRKPLPYGIRRSYQDGLYKNDKAIQLEALCKLERLIANLAVGGGIQNERGEIKPLFDLRSVQDAKKLEAAYKAVIASSIEHFEDVGLIDKDAQ